MSVGSGLRPVGYSLRSRYAVTTKPVLGAGIANEAEHLVVADQWLGGPVFGDLREQTVLDGIPFGSTGGIMRDGSGDAKWVAQLDLDFGFPSP